MIKNIIVAFIFCAFLHGVAFCQEDDGTIEIDSQVMSINPDREYIIIKAGENQGVEIGDGLIVHRDADKLAEAQIVEVRGDVAAAEILKIEKEQVKQLVENIVEKDRDIKEGDSILIVKKTSRPFGYKAVKREIVSQGQKKSKWTTILGDKAAAPAKAVSPGYKPAEREIDYQGQKKSKWTTILGDKARVESAVPVETISTGYAGPGSDNIETLSPDKLNIVQGSSIVRANVTAPAGDVYSYALMVLRENGYSVIISNRVTGNILATTPIELSIMKELWADAGAKIGHRLVVSLEIKDNAGTTELNVYSFKEHTQKDKQVKLPVTRTDPRDTKYYSALVELASRIKKRAES